MSSWKAIFHLLIIYSILFTAFFLTSEVLSIGLPISDILILLTSGLIISLISMIFFLHGKRKDETKASLLTMAAFGIKFGLYMVLLLVYYMLSKIDGTKFLITFFIIYLSFTIYLLRYFIKVLKYNKLKN